MFNNELFYSILFVIKIVNDKIVNFYDVFLKVTKSLLSKINTNIPKATSIGLISLEYTFDENIFIWMDL